MKHLSMFLEDVSLKYLFIGFEKNNRGKYLAKELDRPTFASWDDIVIENGVVLANNIPLNKFKFVMVGVIGSNTDVFSAIKDYLKHHNIKNLCYGTSQEFENKLLQTTRLNINQVPQINSIIAKAGKISASALIKQLKLPVISKITNGSQGKGILKHDTKKELEEFLKKEPDTLFIFQEFIPNDCDYRVFYINDTLVYSIKRVAKDAKEFRNNVSLGGSQDFVELDNEAKEIAGKARSAMGFDVTGVDLIQHKKTKKWYVMEINAAPQFDGPEFIMVMSELIKKIK